MSKSKLKAIRSKDTIVLALDGDTINIQKKTHPELFAEVDALMVKEALLEIESRFLDIKKRIENFTKGVFTVKDNKVMLKGDGVEMPKAIIKKLMELEEAGEDFLPLVRFWRKLKTNPSKNSREQLYSYMLANKMNITEQGDIIFEKGVRRKMGGAPDQLVDGHTGQCDHSIGMVVEMPRDQVNDNPNQTCSRGLHCAPPEYVRDHYSTASNVLIEVVVNPRDVVSVPVDYNQRKVRVCRLQVMGYAGKETRGQQVVKLNDFLQDMPEYAKATPEKSVGGGATPGTVSTKATHTVVGTGNNLQIEVADASKEIEGMTAGAIISYVKDKTGTDIVINIKNKTSIIKKAIEILTKYNEEHAQKMEQEVHELGQGVDTSIVDNMTAKDAIAYIKDNYDVDLSYITLKNKVKIIKEAKAVIQTRAVAETAHKAEDVAGDFHEADNSTEQEAPAVVEAPVEAEEALSIKLSGKTKKELVQLCQTHFNQKPGGMLTPFTAVLKAAKKMFEDAGYIVK